MSYTIDKQVNIFTTNYDMCLEYACEKNHVDYIDGFLGKLEPEFDTQLFGQRIYNTSMLSNKETEKTLINIIKLHGSLSWKTKVKDDKIYYRNILSQDEKNFLTSDSLIDQYEDKENIFNIVLPSKRKFNQTLL